MEQLEQNKYYRWCLLGFIIVTCIHIFSATVTMRGMYLDGAFWMAVLLNNISNNEFAIFYDPGHPRYSVWFLTQTPVFLANYIGIHSKTMLMMIYSFMTISITPVLLFFQYKLAKRTNRLDLYFWSLFIYSLILIMYSLFSVVETPACSILILILFNYLAAKMEYEMRDIINIILLIIFMFNSSEFFLFIGPIFFLSSFYYAYKSGNIQSSIVKIFIGLGSLIATVYMFFYTLFLQCEVKESLRFLDEALGFLKHVLTFCPLISLGALFLLICAFFYKKKMNNITFAICIGVIFWLFISLIISLEFSLKPVLEGQLRTIPFWALPIIILGVFLFDVFKKEINEIKFQNYICIVLICGIAQTSWQLINTYFWDRNIDYLKQRLSVYNEPLYFPDENPPISSFKDKKLHRYIWHSVYVPTSIIFSDTYEIKPLLMPYENLFENGNLSFKEFLKFPKQQDKIIIPMGRAIDIKNKYWDMTDAVEELKIYLNSNTNEKDRKNVSSSCSVSCVNP